MIAARKPAKEKQKSYCFVSYSSREPHLGALIPCLWIALAPHFDLRLTPSALESGSGQRSQIMRLIHDCAFAVVVLNGLRPNVTFEYGLLEAYERPVILLKERNATVDVKSLFGETVGLAVTPPALSVDSHFSDVKDVTWVEWDRLNPAATVRTILQEYRKKKSRIERYIEIPEPVLWSS